MMKSRSEYLREKINSRMDQLQKMMESNLHLKDPIGVSNHIDSVSKFWSALSEEDRDYIHGARFALGSKAKWNVKSNG